jgi:hypothetical protein
MPSTGTRQQHQHGLHGADNSDQQLRASRRSGSDLPVVVELVFC